MTNDRQALRHMAKAYADLHDELAQARKELAEADAALSAANTELDEAARQLNDANAALDELRVSAAADAVRTAELKKELELSRTGNAELLASYRRAHDMVDTLSRDLRIERAQSKEKQLLLEEWEAWDAKQGTRKRRRKKRGAS